MVADNKKSSLIGCCSYGGKTRARPKGTLRSAKNCDREHVKSIAVENEKSPIKSDFCSCGGRTRTCDLQVMSLASYQLLHSAILGFKISANRMQRACSLLRWSLISQGFSRKALQRYDYFPRYANFSASFFVLLIIYAKKLGQSKGKSYFCTRYSSVQYQKLSVLRCQYPRQDNYS